MQQSIDYRALWKSAQKWDRELGKAFGNTGHMRKEGGDPLGYAYGLIGRVIMVSAAMTVIGFVACSLIMLHLPTFFIHAGSLALGLCLYLGAQTLYPGTPGFALAFIFFIGATVIVGMAAAITGHAPMVTARVLSEVALPIALGLIVAVELLSFIVRMIMDAFTEPPITFRKLRLAGLLSREEVKASRRYPRWVLPAFFLSITPLVVGSLLMLSAVDNPEAMKELLAIVALTSLPFVGLMLWVDHKENSLLAIAIDRLGGEASVRAQLGLPE